MDKKDAAKMIVLYFCPNCAAIYTTPKTTCLNKNCALQFDTIDEPRGLRLVAITVKAYQVMMDVMGEELGFVHCGCSGDHCPDCVTTI